jgi:hypothetical protein
LLVRSPWCLLWRPEPPLFGANLSQYVFILKWILGIFKIQISGIIYTAPSCSAPSSYSLEKLSHPPVPTVAPLSIAESLLGALDKE